MELTRNLVSLLLADVQDSLEPLRRRLLDGDSLSSDGAEAAAEVADGRADDATVDNFIALANSGNSPGEFYLAALLARSTARAHDSVSLLDRAICACPTPRPNLLSTRARWRVRAGNFAGAADDLRQAYNAHPPYSFYSKTERLLGRIGKSGV